jgi:hypothetical protein
MRICGKRADARHAGLQAKFAELLDAELDSPLATNSATNWRPRMIWLLPAT